MARPHGWGRSQKYHDRPRHLYALLFDNGCCYVGQSVDPTDRLQQHRAVAGGWAGNKFHMIPLGVVMGTFQDAEHYEYAWRHKASRAGWRIYGKPGVLVNPGNRLTWRRRLIAMTLTWPRKHRRRGWVASNWGWLLLALVLLVVLRASMV